MKSPLGLTLSPAKINQAARLIGCAPAQLQTLITQKRVTSWPYYSKVKFVATRAVSGAGFAYTLAAGTEIRAFGYAVGQQKQGAGFVAGDGNATIADTNLITGSQTVGGQSVKIHGIALQIQPASLHDEGGANQVVRMADARFIAALHEAVSVEIALNADENRFRLGTMGMVPGAGGLTGGSEDASGDNTVVGRGKNLEFPNSGWPVKSNFFRVPEGLIWRAQSHPDSNLNLVFRVQNTIELFSGGSPENLVGDTAVDNAPANVATAEGYSFPVTLCATVMCYLVGEVVGERTRSA